MAWDVLENTVIGTFIFSLGQAVGLLSCEPIGVELLQQTPLDTSLGDVLIAKATFVRLIEFKRELNKSPKEHAKRSGRGWRSDDGSDMTSARSATSSSGGAASASSVSNFSSLAVGRSSRAKSAARPSWSINR